jgi:hypothetical protein
MDKVQKPSDSERKRDKKHEERQEEVINTEGRKTHLSMLLAFLPVLFPSF